MAQSRLWPAGTLCVTIAANIAETAILTYPACFPDSVVGFIADKAKCDVYFIEYLFRHVRRQIQHEAIGSVQYNINLETLGRLAFPLPPLSEQKAVVAILKTLDDKIEINHRMNQALESMARAIFKSWFVDFEPVQERNSLSPRDYQPSPLGEIPAGWSVQRIGNFCEFAYGKALKAEERHVGTIPVFGSNGPIGWHDYALVEGPGIIVGRKGNPGTVAWSSRSFFPIDTTFYVVVRRDLGISLLYLFYALASAGLPALAADSAVPGLNRNLAYQSDILIPPNSVMGAFENLVQPLHGKIDLNNEEAETLAAIRDTLLPKLLSGEIRVKQAEKIVGEAV